MARLIPLDLRLLVGRDLVGCHKLGEKHGRIERLGSDGLDFRRRQQEPFVALVSVRSSNKRGQS